MDLDHLSIGKRVRRCRRRRKLTQEKLSELCGVSEQHISNIERGKSIPSTEMVMRLAIALDTTPDEFLVGTVRRGGEDRWRDVAELLRGMDEKRLALAESFLTWLREQEL